MDRFDERDTIFSRLSLKKGTKKYVEYYNQNPEKKKIDDNLRKKQKEKENDKINSLLASSSFSYLHKIREHVTGEVNEKQIKTGPEEITKKIKGFAQHQGAVLIGVTEVDEDYIYSHYGRPLDYYGKKINLDHKYAVVFAVEMNKRLVNQAPEVEQEIEVAKGYLNAGRIGNLISNFIRELGFGARNHMSGAYQVILPPLAEKAGLGEIGRLGLLVTKEYGPRVRLGVVTTNLNLNTDDKNEFGLKKFCNQCRKCANLCPGNAISKTDSKKTWKINSEKCYSMWQEFGTDCGVCLAVCPFSQEVAYKTLIEEMKDDEEKMNSILKKYKERYGRRPSAEKPDWLK